MSADTSDTYSTVCWVCFLLPELKTFFEGGLKLKNAIIKLKIDIIKTDKCNFSHRKLKNC